MKLNKREKIFVITLIAIIFAFALYKFVVKPQGNTVETLKSERNMKLSSLKQLKTDIASESKMDIKLLGLEDKVEKKSGKFFTEMTQEDIILLIEDFSKQTKLKIPNISFPEMRIEKVVISQETEETKENKAQDDEEKPTVDLKVHSADLQYQGNYYSLLDFLDSVAGYEKRILVEDLNMQKNQDGYLKGNIVLDFYSIENIIPNGERIYNWETNLGSVVGDPFLEFSGYYKASGNQDGVSSSEAPKDIATLSSDTQSLLEYYYKNDFNSNNSERNGNYNGNQTNYKIETKDLFTFEDIKTLLFSGNSKDIKGEMSLEKNIKTQGSASLNLEYDFIEERRYSVANLSFNNNVVIKEQPQAISIDVNPLDKSSCRIGVFIRDREGNYYKLPLKETLNWNGWETLTVELPVDINYPAVVERVYIESYDHYKKLTGKILMDNMKLIYEK